MRKTIALYVILLLILPCALSGRTPLEEMKIICKPGKKGRFVFSDNLTGYYGGKPFRYEGGSIYYDFTDFVAFTDGSFLNKRKAKEVHIFPHKVRSIHPHSWEETVMFAREKAMGLRVGSSKPRRLGIFPIIYLYNSETRIRKQGSTITLEVPKKKKFIAISADTPIRFRKITYKGDRKLYRHILFRGNTVKLLIESANRCRAMNLVITWGKSRREALLKARRHIRRKTWLREDRRVNALLNRSRLKTGNSMYDRAVLWSLASAYSMVVEEFGTGIWAGLPWFRDNWGRDTFIALPGTLLVSGRFREARAVIRNFARFQNLGKRVIIMKMPKSRFRDAVRRVRKVNGISHLQRKGRDLMVNPVESIRDNRYRLLRLLNRIKRAVPFCRATAVLLKDKTYGRIPNRVSRKDIIYNTADGTPWFIREIWEYLQYSGDRRFGRSIFNTVRTALEGAIRYRTDGRGFLVHGEADTWMDARIQGRQAWSPRDNRAVEIQVLWNEALRTGAKLARLNRKITLARKWAKLAEKHKKEFLKLFWNNRKKRMADRVSKNGKRDFSCRPNQLMLLSVPLAAGFVPEPVGAHIVKKAVNTLLFPYGITSLDPKHPWFHPYHEHKNYHKDAAYHNGTIWGWNAGFTVSALTRYARQNLAWKLSRNLARQILEQGCLGSMSENLHAWPGRGGRIKLSGTFSQAWSVSEYARNAFQDYAGFRPRLMDNTVILEPAIPDSVKSISANFAFGSGGQFHLRLKTQAGKKIWTITMRGIRRGLVLRFRPLIGRTRYTTRTVIYSGRTYRFVLAADRAPLCNGRMIRLKPFRKNFPGILRGLRFAAPDSDARPRSIRRKQYLKKIILNKN